jgi:hypothetical protein
MGVFSVRACTCLYARRLSSRTTDMTPENCKKQGKSKGDTVIFEFFIFLTERERL